MRRNNQKIENKGLSLVLALSDVRGLAQVGRDFLSKVTLTDVNFEVIEESTNNILDKVFDKLNCRRIFKKKPLYKKIIHFETVPKKLNTDYYNIKTIFWEFESGMLEYRPKSFEGVNEVIAFTDFIYNYLKKIAPQNVKITKMKYPFVENWGITLTKDEVRSRYNIGKDDFVCLFNFDYRSYYDRKNPEATLRAFAESLGAKKDAKLIIKTTGYRKKPELVKKLKEFARNLNIMDKIIFINKNLPRNEVVSLINASDCYISLHRGEGLGLGMLEAMALSKPVIATNYSGNTEFTKEDNSLLVDYELVDTETKSKAYLWVEKWAEPNLNTAKEHLQRLHGDREFAEKIGINAKKFVEEYFNLKDFKNELNNIVERGL